MSPLSSRLSPLLLAALLGPGCVAQGPNPNPTPVKDPCDPNPCTQGAKTTCANENGVARCLCAPGTVQRPNGACEPLSVLNCPEHLGDASEPDDCLARAVVLAPTGTSSRQQSIEPVGDYDFFRVEGSARNVYTVTVKPGEGSVLPRVDVFDQAGLWLASQDGQPQVQLGFKARAAAPYYVRVSHSPKDASAAIGLYTLALSAPVQDDYGDTSDAATALTVNAGSASSPVATSGVLEYGQDEDWFSFPTKTKSLYRVEFNTASPNLVPTLTVFTKEDVKNPLLVTPNAYVEFKADTSRFYLDVSSAKGLAGPYAIRVFEYATP